MGLERRRSVEELAAWNAKLHGLIETQRTRAPEQDSISLVATIGT